MKAIETSEKIYVTDATFPDYVDFDESLINTKEIDDHDIKYTRTDAFIEKACNYLSYHLDPSKMDVNYKFDFIEEFRKYMKGE